MLTRALLCVRRPSPPAGGILRIKAGLESRLGAPQREALLCSYAGAALLANKNDVAKEAIRWGRRCARLPVLSSLACPAACVHSRLQ